MQPHGQDAQSVQRYRFDLAYDGTGYAGWQVQPNGLSVQEAVEQAIRRVRGVEAKLHGSGRTDQGVHARCQVAHADLPEGMEPAGLKRALNAVLASDIRILRVRRVPQGFHARRSAVSKEYRYFVWNDDPVPPFLCRYRTPVQRRLDVDAMQGAARLLVGRHDFAAFTANPNRTVESTVRTLHALRVTRKGAEVTIAAVGEGFLYKMVRSLAGWLIRVGEGAVSPAQTREILDSAERTARVPTAPPQGLFLWRVAYR
jgi:tRNA pseudouridine38-40 synthase